MRNNCSLIRLCTLHHLLSSLPFLCCMLNSVKLILGGAYVWLLYLLTSPSFVALATTLTP